MPCIRIAVSGVTKNTDCCLIFTGLVKYRLSVYTLLYGENLMKTLRCFTVCIVLLSALILTTCGNWSGEDYAGNFEYRLQGTWKTNDIDSAIYIYLTITHNTIKIEDASYGWPYVDINASTHPFKGLTLNYPNKGYSEKIDDRHGIIYIEDFGDIYEFPYEYNSTSQSFDKIEIIRFTFPSPEVEPNKRETLIKYIKDTE